MSLSWQSGLATRMLLLVAALLGIGSSGGACQRGEWCWLRRLARLLLLMMLVD
jgi:hypothetical protein